MKKARPDLKAATDREAEALEWGAGVPTAAPVYSLER